MDFDEVLGDFGRFGTYQKMIVYVVLLPAVVPCGFHAYNQIFMSAKPYYWCKTLDSERESFAVTVVARNSSTFPDFGANVSGECFRQNRSGEIAEEVACKDGWIYDSSKYLSTIVTEWNLVCDDDFYPTFALAMFGVGGLVGNYIFGNIQDWMGRKIAFFICLTVECTFSIASAFAPNFWSWVALRFGVGLTVPAILESPLVLAVELVGPQDRTYIITVVNIAYSIGLVLLSGIFYAVRDWRRLTLVTTLPFLILFFYWWVLPESPRWLFAKGRFDECSKILSKMASVNKIDLPSDYMNNLKQKSIEKFRLDVRETERRYGTADLFRYSNLRKQTILITFIWFVITAVYVGLSYYAPALHGDEFFNFFISGAVELPSYLFLWPAMEKLGRRWTLCIAMTTGGFACLTTFLTQTWETITLGLYCVGKIGISSSFVVLPLIASEIYPTVVRGIGISFSSVVGQIGPIVIPLVNYLGEEWMVLPLMLMGGLLIIGGAASLILPETLHRKLPESLEDAETFEQENRTNQLHKQSA